MRFTLIACGVIITALCVAPTAQADFEMGFRSITNNVVTDARAAESQLRVTVSAFYNLVDTGLPSGMNYVIFKFFNDGPYALSITDVYFDDGTLLGLDALVDSDDNLHLAGLEELTVAGVDYSRLAKPANLPGGNAVGFEATAGFTADSDPAVQPNGVNPGESLGVIFSLKDDQFGNPYGLSDTIAALLRGLPGKDDPLGEPTLSIGVHVQGFDSGGSESLIVTPIPVPGALALGCIGLGLVGWVKRRIA